MSSNRVARSGGVFRYSIISGSSLALPSGRYLSGSRKRQSLDDRARAILRVRIAGRNQACKVDAQMAQFADARVDKSQLGGGKLSRRPARAAPLQSEQTAYLCQCESHCLRASNEAYTVGVRLRVSPEAAEGPQGFGHQL